MDLVSCFAPNYAFKIYSYWNNSISHNGSQLLNCIGLFGEVVPRSHHDQGENEKLKKPMPMTEFSASWSGAGRHGPPAKLGSVDTENL